MCLWAIQWRLHVYFLWKGATVTLLIPYMYWVTNFNAVDQIKHGKKVKPTRKSAWSACVILLEQIRHLGQAQTHTPNFKHLGQAQSHNPNTKYLGQALAHKPNDKYLGQAQTHNPNSKCLGQTQTHKPGQAKTHNPNPKYLGQAQTHIPYLI